MNTLGIRVNRKRSRVFARCGLIAVLSTGFGWKSASGEAAATAPASDEISVLRSVSFRSTAIAIEAYDLLDGAVLDRDLAYLSDVLLATGPVALTRPTWRLDNGRYPTVASGPGSGARFPLRVQATPTGLVPVSLFLLPSPSETGLTKIDGENSDEAKKFYFSRGSSTRWFPWMMASSEFGYAAPLVLRLAQPQLDDGAYVLPGWMLETDAKEFIEALGFDRASGAKLRGIVSCIAVNDGVYRATRSEAEPASPRTWLAFPIHDANGGRRGQSYIDEKGRSAFSFPLTVIGDDPRIGSHSLHVLPAPLPESIRWPQERICVPESVAAMDPPVALLRRLPGSEPFREHLELSFGPDAMARDWADAECIAVFANIEPSDLLDVVARMAKVEVDPECRNRVVEHLRSLPRATYEPKVEEAPAEAAPPSVPDPKPE